MKYLAHVLTTKEVALIVTSLAMVVVIQARGIT